MYKANLSWLNYIILLYDYTVFNDLRSCVRYIYATVQQQIVEILVKKLLILDIVKVSPKKQTHPEN